MIYKLEAEGTGWTDFRGYQNPVKLFKRLRKCDVILSKAKYKSKHGKGLQLLTPKICFKE